MQAKHCDKCGSGEHNRQDCFLKKKAQVECFYEDEWWNAEILVVHRGKKGGYKIHYFDDEDCTESHVPAERIRPRCTGESKHFVEERAYK